MSTFDARRDARPQGTAVRRVPECRSNRGPRFGESLMKLRDRALATTIVATCAAPAAAQRYTAKQDGDLVELADTTAQMHVSVVWSMSNAWRIQVKGKDLVRTSATLADFQARP